MPVRDIVFLSAVVLFAVAALCALRRVTSRPRHFAVIFRDGSEFESQEIVPSPMDGCHVLEIEMPTAARAECRWEKAPEAPRFFWKKAIPYREYRCPGDTFVLRISGMGSEKPSLVGAYLPEWNMKGTDRSHVDLPKAIHLHQNIPCRISLRLRGTDIRSCIFKITPDAVYIKSIRV